MMVSERFQRRVEGLLEEGDQAIPRYDSEAVRQTTQAVLAIDPGNSDGLAFLAAVERALGHTPDAPNTEPPVLPQPPIPARVSPRPLPMAATR